MRRWLGLGVGVVFVSALIIIEACSDFESTDPTTAPDASEAGPVAQIDASVIEDAGTTTDVAITPDADGAPPVDCPSADTTPCNCIGGRKECRIRRDAGHTCYNYGDQDRTEPDILRCTGSTCLDAQRCCFLGAVTTSTTACLNLSFYSTECRDAGVTCETMVCASDMDCTKYDAGVCRKGMIEYTSRVLGVCVRQ